MKNKDTKPKGAYASLSGAKRAVPIVLFALALFIGLCFITPDGVGLGKYIGRFFTGLFSFGGYFIPFLLAIHGIFYPSDVQKKRVLTRVIFSLITLLVLAALLHTIKSFSHDIPFDVSAFYKDGQQLSGGGFFGGIVGYALMKVLGHVGIIIFAILIFALYVVYFFSNGKSALAKAMLFVLDKISAFLNKSKVKKEEKKKLREAKKKDAEAPRIAAKHSDLYDDEFFAVDNGMSEFKIDRLGIHETRSQKDVEAHPHLEEKVRHENKENQFIDYAECETDKEEESIFYEEKANDSAEQVFAANFDPFNFERNADLREKQASKTNTEQEIGEFAEPIRTFSEAEIEKARKRADFDMKKRSFMEMEEQRRLAEEAEMREKEAEHKRIMEERQRAAEEAEREARLRELIKDEPTPIKATYTSYEKTEAPERSTYRYDMPIEDTPVIDRESYFVERELKLEEDTSISFDDSATDSSHNTLYDNNSDNAENGSFPEIAVNTEPGDEKIFMSRSQIHYDVPTLSDDEDDEEEFYTGEPSDAVYSEEESEDDGGELFAEPLTADMQNPDVIAYQNMYKSVLEINTTPTSDINPDYTADAPGSTEEELDYDAPFDVFETPDREPIQQKAQEKPKGPDYSNYKLPTLDLLKKATFDIDMDAIREDVNRNAEKLIETLDQFNVKATIRSTDVGPRITRYELVPAKGVRVNSVMSLVDDISLNLAAEGMRMEAPIPGKAAIGIEIPNKNPQTVYLRDLLETEEFQNSTSPTMACIGKDVTGNPVLGDIAKMPHMLVAGATGMGKSVCMNSILISMLYKARPDELKFIMIDPKMVEFNGYNGIPHLLIPVIIDVKQAAGALMWAVEQMDKRFEVLKEYSVKNLDGYNEKVKANPKLGEPMPKIIVVIDELNDLMLQARKPVEDLIMRIAQKARAAGIHLIIGTQRPSVDVITGVIKANIPSRISCKVASHTDSKTILEQAGAEKLLNNGDMLFFPVGKPKPTRVQGAFVSDSEVEKIMNFLKAQNKGNAYDEQAIDEINKAAQKCTKGGKDDSDSSDDGDSGAGYFNDPQFLEAVSLAIKQGKIATSLIQRKIGVGYGKAAKFIDIMEEQGIVSEPNGQKPRDVLITADEWHEILARRSLD